MGTGPRERHAEEEPLLVEEGALGESAAPADDESAESPPGWPPAATHHRPSPAGDPSDVGTHHLLAVLVGCVCMLCAGSLYAYGVYSDQLKVRLGWTESEMELVGYLGDCGSYLTSMFTGALQDAYGPRWSALGAASLLGVGFAGMAFGLATRAFTSPLAYGLLLFLTGAGSGWIYSAVLCTNIEMFPRSYRGKLVGVLVSQNGLSALVFTLMYETLFAGTDTIGFLACASAICVAVCVSGSMTLPWLLKATNNIRWDKGTAALPSTSARQGHTSLKAAVWLALTSPAFWLLGVVCFLLTGNGLMVINNLGSLATAADPTGGRRLRGPLVGVLSLCNCAGRLLSGFLSDLLPVRRGVFFIAASAIFSGAFLQALVLRSVSALWVLTVSVGIAYGAVWSILLSTISEVFGEEHFGLNSGLTVMLFAATGVLVFNTIAGAAYDAAGDGHGHCTAGWECFHTPLALGLACSLVAGVLSMLLVPMTPIGRKL